jgi:hypothetical protein
MFDIDWIDYVAIPVLHENSMMTVPLALYDNYDHKEYHYSVRLSFFYQFLA